MYLQGQCRLSWKKFINCIIIYAFTYWRNFFFYFLAFFIWQEEDAFFTDYAISHKKLSELGFTRPSLGASRTSTRQSAVVVAVAAMMVIFGYFFDFFKIYKKSHQKWANLCRNTKNHMICDSNWLDLLFKKKNMIVYRYPNMIVYIFSVWKWKT